MVVAARRRDRLDALADEIGARAAALDVTDSASVAAFADTLPHCDVLVNNAGGAVGMETVAEADVDAWRTMYETNVLGTLHMTKALLPKLIASGDGHVLNVTSTAARLYYEGGAGYNAAKSGQAALTEVLRVELLGQPVRVTEVAPGLVRTEEFSLVRYRGDAERAAKVYEGVVDPLSADDVADCIAWALTRPAHVNIDQLVVRPRAQAGRKLHRESR
ncbi:NADP-dependent 3-hydroxy acid dehydrogenase YdfG [Allonocardiopsis opalescens]|uniref:NADP-dependent 3-hydroxy acid dehydrogenase YdfG n=1 Tax=Allonocardiopsis opalescens TaxID=1144618 RepID=A0A2T0QA93_9ACTN|nr:NADP-dependent 3-hydroxy acid dehydrogenase YdfG [Allonocardiopsis opalescens]